MSQNKATPVTIVTGFLGSGKTTLIINLIPQLPKSYKLALLKNEFGDVAVDSQLASAQSIAGVRELLNGCICCNLVGQLGDALETLRETASPDRIVIETSGSAFPATLAMEVNRLTDQTGHFVLDGVVSVIDVENWEGYEDTSYTARMQHKYTDLVIFNKHENVDERRFDICLDRLGDLEMDTPWVKSDRGVVSKDVLLGIDGAMASKLEEQQAHAEHEDKHDHKHDHQSEVEVLSISLPDEGVVDMSKLQELLEKAPKEEVYRIKAVLKTSTTPKSSEATPLQDTVDDAQTGPQKYILNWAFGRWTFTRIPRTANVTSADSNGQKNSAALNMTIITARDESTKWRKRIEEKKMIVLEGSDQPAEIRRVS